MMPVAIAGAACELPGAHSLDELWQNVLAQRPAFRSIPAHRLDLSAYAPGTAAPAETIACRVAAFVTGYAFQRERHRIPATTFRQADMAHWLALDVAARAIANAELRTGALNPARTAVVVANTLTGETSRAALMRDRWPYVRRVLAGALDALPAGTVDVRTLIADIEERYKAPFAAADDETLAGGLSNTIAGRICNAFDFGGGGYVVDGACASSLVALASACDVLRRGDVDAVVVGAVDVSIDPFELVGFSRLGALASDEMRVFTREPPGFLPGEGAAFIVLRTALHGRILGLVRGIALSSDGAGGITRPEVHGQLRALRAAYAAAACDPRDVALFEAHGTGTAVGDDVELRALRQLRDERGQALPSYVGSVKSLVGHTKACAGMAGLLKALMAARRGIVPPHGLRGAPHPALGGTLRVAPQALPWPADRPRLAGVSAFGFGGINAHAVVEGVPAPRRAVLARREVRQIRAAQDCELILVGAHDAEQLAAKLAVLGTQIAAMSAAELADLAIASAAEARDDAHRAAIVIERPWDCGKGLARLARAAGRDALADHDAGVYYGNARTMPRLAFLFPGQAAPVRTDAGLLGRRFPELDEPFAACPAGDRLSTAVAQPAIVAASLAGLDLMRRLGIGARVAIGHSLGELVALHWAGAYDRDTLVALARERGEIMQRTCARGTMASIGAGAQTVRGLLRGGAVVACDNADDTCVIAGDDAGVAATVAAARAAQIGAIPLPVTTPFHSPAIEPAREAFRVALHAHRLGAPVRTVVSTVHGRNWLERDDVAMTLERQLVAPVLFRAALAHARETDLAVEVGSGDTLHGLGARAFPGRVISLDVGGESVRGALALAGYLYAVSGDAHAARALAAGRFARAPVLNAAASVFANPCGSPEPEDPAPRAARPVIVAAAPEVDAATPVFDIVRAMIARRVELPPATIARETRLLDDLHLSSLAVGQLVAEIAAASGAEPPADLLRFANASAGEIAGAIERARSAGAVEPAPEAAGVAPWVRRFRVAELPAGEPRDAIVHDWIYHSAAGGALDDALRRRLVPARAGARAHALLLADAPPVDLARRLLEFAHDVTADPAASRALFVLHDCAGASFARSFALERPELAVAVVTVAGDTPPGAVLDAVCADAGAAASYHETVVREGRRLRRELRHDGEPSGALEHLGAGDVLLVSGGGKGIGAECAFARVLASGAALIVLGRSAPGADADLDANLARFVRAGIRFRYVRADVRDAAAVRRGVADAVAVLGPVTAVLHAAGTNEPRAIGALTLDDVAATIATKVDGARNVLAACDSARLRELVAFGSVIAETGMHGEAHYALANELLSRDVEAFARVHPACRAIVAEWSVWSGVGMGARLDSIDALARLGVAAIPPERGIAAYLDLVRDENARGSVVVCGRLGAFPTLPLAAEPLPLLRFLERTAVYQPAVELVVDATLAHGTDPYLNDHRIDGLAVVPGVVLVEAMVQAASALLDAPVRELRDVVFAQPVIVPDAAPRTIRIAALREAGAVRVELRSDETGFRLVHASATAVAAASAAAPASVPAPASAARPAAADVYASILFHRGRFAAVRAYRALTARRCIAAVAASTAPWFSTVFPQTLLWGDAAVRDAAIHALQACVPEARVLPAAIGRITRHAGTPFGDEVLIDAHEIARGGGEYVFDVSITDASGAALETIAGLVLRRSAAAASRPIPASLVATAIERRLLDAGAGEIAVEAFAPPSGERWETAPSGRPANGASRCYARGLELRCTSGAGGIDAEFAGEVTAQAWRRVTAVHDAAVLCAAELAAEAEERVRARVWCALEAAKKTDSVTPRTISVRAVRPDGVTIFATGGSDVATFCIDTTEAPEPLVVAVALRAHPARRDPVAS